LLSIPSFLTSMNLRKVCKAPILAVYMNESRRIPVKLHTTTSAVCLRWVAEVVQDSSSWTVSSPVHVHPLYHPPPLSGRYHLSSNHSANFTGKIELDMVNVDKPSSSSVYPSLTNQNGLYALCPYLFIDKPTPYHRMLHQRMNW
jgi:hypothetical protein